MGGKSVSVRVSPTGDLAKVLSCLHGVKPEGNVNLRAGLQVRSGLFDLALMLVRPCELARQVAQLALKHRQNKNQRQRIICFVGSPVAEDQKELVKLGKKLKKNSVALDIVNFGEDAENLEKLQALVETVNSGDNRCRVIGVTLIGGCV